jgi:hypothetical protein
MPNIIKKNNCYSKKAKKAKTNQREGILIKV